MMGLEKQLNGLKNMKKRAPIKFIGKKPVKSFHIHIRTCGYASNYPIKSETRCITIQDFTGLLTTDSIRKKIEKIFKK